MKIDFQIIPKLNIINNDLFFVRTNRMNTQDTLNESPRVLTLKLKKHRSLY